PAFVAFPPGAVTLYGARPGGTSARNLWRCEVAGLETHGDQIRAELTGELSLAADLTTVSAAELDLHPCTPACAAVKAAQTHAYPAVPPHGRRGGGPSHRAARRRGEAEPGVPVAPPAPAGLRGVTPVPAVAAGAVADPEGGRAGVELPVRLAQPGADGHEAPVAFQGLGQLEHPVHALAEQQRGAARPGERGQGLLRAPVGQVIARVDAGDRVEGGVGQVDAQGREAVDVLHVRDDEAGLAGVAQ